MQQVTVDTFFILFNLKQQLNGAKMATGLLFVIGFGKNCHP